MTLVRSSLPALPAQRLLDPSQLFDDLAGPGRRAQAAPDDCSTLGKQRRIGARLLFVALDAIGIDPMGVLEKEHRR
jgi:hypothetical protein